MLLLAAAFWGLGTVVIKDTVDSFPPIWLVGIRFTSAGIITSLVLLPRVIRCLQDRKNWSIALLLGVFLALTYLFNSVGLLFTSASKSTFYTNTYCIMVPFIMWAFYRRRPVRASFFAAVLCVAGISLVSLAQGVDSFDFNVGDGLTMVSAAAVATHLVLVAHFSKGRDALALTCLQFLVCGIFSIAIAPLFEGIPDFTMLRNPDVLGNMVYLVLFASCAALSLQNVGISHVETAAGSLLLATECLFGVFFSVLLLGELVTPIMVAGFVVIAVAVVISQVFTPEE